MSATPHRATQLTEEITRYTTWLNHESPAIRLIGLRAIQETVAALIKQESTARQMALIISRTQEATP